MRETQWINDIVHWSRFWPLYSPGNWINWILSDHELGIWRFEITIFPFYHLPFYSRYCIMIDSFMYHLDWSKGYPDSSKTLLLDIFFWMTLQENRIWIRRLLHRTCLPQCEANLMKTTQNKQTRKGNLLSFPSWNIPLLLSLNFEGLWILEPPPVLKPLSLS